MDVADQLLDVLFGEAFAHHHKLVAPEAADHIVPFAGVLQRPRDEDHGTVALRVPETVVDGLEAVGVDHQAVERVVIRGMRQEPGDLRLEREAVAHPGQEVDAQQVLLLGKEREDRRDRETDRQKRHTVGDRLNDEGDQDRRKEHREREVLLSLDRRQSLTPAEDQAERQHDAGEREDHVDRVERTADVNVLFGDAEDREPRERDQRSKVDLREDQVEKHPAFPRLLGELQALVAVDQPERGDAPDHGEIEQKDRRIETARTGEDVSVERPGGKIEENVNGDQDDHDPVGKRRLFPTRVGPTAEQCVEEKERQSEDVEEQIDAVHPEILSRAERREARVFRLGFFRVKPVLREETLFSIIPYADKK